MRRILLTLLVGSVLIPISHAFSQSIFENFSNSPIYRVFSSDSNFCRERYPVDVSVSYETPQYEVHSVDNVSRYAKGLASIGDNWTINGLTSGILTGGISIRGAETPDCFYPKGVRFVFKYEDPINIFILSRYQPGSCNFDVILNHELTHFEIFKNSPRELDEYIRTAAVSAIDHYFDFYLNKGMGTQENFTHLLQSTINMLVRDIDANSQRKHQLIDSREAYMEQATLCPSW